MKISEFCERLDPRGTYNADTIGTAFKSDTGRDPCWPTHSPEETAAAISAYGGVGAQVGRMFKPQVYGYEVVASCAENFAGQCGHNQLSGLGFIYQLAMHEIKRWEGDGEPCPKQQ